MVINCKQCNRAFKITDSEIKFYKRKGFDLPKRCKNCRALNKSKKVNIPTNNDYSYSNYTESYAKKNYFPIVAVITVFIVIATITTMLIVIKLHKVNIHTRVQNTTAVTYYLNTYRHKFHKPSCSSVWEMNPKNKKAFYGTREEAIERGYSPCQNCNP